MFLLAFAITSLILVIVAHMRYSTDVNTGRVGADAEPFPGWHILLAKYGYLVLVMCEIGLFYEMLLGRLSVLHIWNILDTTGHFRDAPWFMMLVYYPALGLAAASAFFLFFNIPDRLTAVTRVLVVPVAMLIAQAMVSDRPIIFYVMEDAFIRITALVAASALLWGRFTRMIVREEKKASKTRGVKLAILLLACFVAPPALLAAWTGVSISRELAALSGGDWVKLLSLGAPLIVAIADGTRCASTSLAGFVDGLGKKML